jgi:hypothetical protein
LYDIYLPHHFKNKKEQGENLRRSADDFHVARFVKYSAKIFKVANPRSTCARGCSGSSL